MPAPPSRTGQAMSSRHTSAQSTPVTVAGRGGSGVPQREPELGAAEARPHGSGVVGAGWQARRRVALPEVLCGLETGANGVRAEVAIGLPSKGEGGAQRRA